MRKRSIFSFNVAWFDRPAVTILAVSALCLLTTTGCSTGKKDPRAYPGSPGGESLEKVLNSFELQLPPCQVGGLGFSGTSQRSDANLSLSFRAPKECVDKFLEGHGVNVNDPIHWPYGEAVTDGKKLSPTRPPFDKKDMKRYGWHFDPTRQYNSYIDFQTSNGASFKVVVDPERDQQTVYMRSNSSPRT